MHSHGFLTLETTTGSLSGLLPHSLAPLADHGFPRKLSTAPTWRLRYMAKIHPFPQYFDLTCQSREPGLLSLLLLIMQPGAKHLTEHYKPQKQGKMLLPAQSAVRWSQETWCLEFNGCLQSASKLKDVTTDKRICLKSKFLWLWWLSQLQPVFNKRGSKPCLLSKCISWEFAVPSPPQVLR